MSLQIISEGVSKLRSSNGKLIISQDGLSAFEVRPNKIIKSADYIFCNNYTFKKGFLIPIISCYFKGSGSATINVFEKTNIVSGLTAGEVSYVEYLDVMNNVLNQSDVNVVYRQSSCKSNVTDSTILSSEQQACLTRTDFDQSKYSLSYAAPSINNTLTDVTETSTSPIGISVSDKHTLTITQSGATSNVYYSIGVVLSWES